MSWMNRPSPPEPEFTDDEWDTATEALFDEWADRGWPRTDAAKHIDDYLIVDKCQAMRDNRAADMADDEYDRRKEAS